MKRIYLFVIAIIAMFAITACQQEGLNDVKEESTSDVRTESVSTYSKYLEINEDLDHTEISTLTIEEEKIYYEAKDRFGKIVDYKDQQFYLLHHNNKVLNISEDLFNHFEKIMNRSNEGIRGLEQQKIGRIVCYSNVQPNLIRTRNRTEETPIGGINGFERTWSGFDVYLSNTTLVAISAGAGVIGSITTYIPDPTLSKAVAAACGITSALSGFAASTCPDGVVISFLYPVPVPGGCLPYNVSKQ